MSTTAVIKQLSVKFTADTSGVAAGLQRMNTMVADSTQQMRNNYGALTDTLRNVGLAMTAAVTAPLLLLAKTSVNAAADMESLKLALTTVTGSAKSASEEMKTLAEIAKLPGLGLREAAQAAIGLQSAGLGMKDTLSTVREFGNAIAKSGGDKQAFAGVMDALKSMMGEGKVSLEYVKEMGRAFPGLRKEMKETFGTSMPEQISAMGISVEDFTKKLVDHMSKSSRVSGGLRNSLDNLDDTLFNLKVSIGNMLASSGLSTWLQNIANAAERATAALKEMSPAAKSAVMGLGLATVLTGPFLMLISIIPQLVEGFKLLKVGITALRVAMAAAGASALANPYVLIAVAVIALIALIVKFRNQLGLTDGNLKKMGQGIKQFFQPAIDFLGYAWGQLKALWESMQPALQRLWTSIVGMWDAAKPIYEALKEAIGSILLTIGKIVGGAILLAFKAQFETLLAVLKLAAWWITKVADALTYVANIIAGASDALRKFLGLQNSSNSSNGPTLIGSILDKSTEAIRRGAKEMADYYEEQKKRTQQTITDTQARINAINEEMKAEKNRRLQQVGFTSLRGMWQKGMEAGAKEVFSITGKSASRAADLRELEKQNKNLEKILKAIEKKQDGYNQVANQLG